MKFGTEDGSLGFPTIATSMVVTRPLPLFSYSTTVGIHTSLLLFTALFLPRTSSAIFNDTSEFPFLQSASSLDRPQPKSLEALTASPPLTLAWLCAGVFLISLLWSGRIRHQAYEQHKHANRTDFEAKKEEMEWRKQGTVVGYTLSYISRRHLKPPQNLRKSLVSSLPVTAIFHGLIVISAHLLPGTSHPPVGTHKTLTRACSYPLHTFLLALLLSLLAYFPTAHVLGSPSLAMLKDGNADVVLRFAWVRIFAEFK